MKRKIRKQIHISIEMSEEEANHIRTVLWYLTDLQYIDIAKFAKFNGPDHLAEIKETVSELCMELEVYEGE